MSDLNNDARSISRLIGDAFEQLSQLVQTEIRLARAELAEKATSAGHRGRLSSSAGCF